MYQSDLSIHAKVKHITGADPGGESGANYGGSSLQQAHSYYYDKSRVHDASIAHTKLVKDSKQTMAITSTLLRYTTVVAPEVS